MNKFYPQPYWVTIFRKDPETNNPKKISFRISFISTRLAKLILKKSIKNEWMEEQIPCVPTNNYLGFEDYNAAFSSPNSNHVLFVKKYPGIYKNKLYV